MGRQKKRGRGIDSKKRQLKKKEQKKRRLRRQVLEDKTINRWGIGPTNVAVKPIIRLHKRDSTLEQEIYGKLVEHDDHRVENTFKVIDGRASCIYTALDKSTNDVVFVAKVNLYRDMTDVQKSQYQRLFSYFAKDQAIKGHQHLKNGAGARGGGHMNAVGWRPGYETGVHIDTYTSGIRRGRFPIEEIQEHEDQLESIHSSIADSFNSLSSFIFNQQCAELREAKTPAAGGVYGAKDSDLDGLFCSNIAYTYGGFHNSVHCDRDTSSYTYGMFAHTEEGTGRLVEEQNSITGFSFLNIPYRIRVLLSEIDGVVELIWRGPTDGHCTTTGIGDPSRQTHRMACTCQITKRLVERANMYRTQFSVYHARANLDDNHVIKDADAEDADYLPD